jgi:hypothetical protein
LIVLPTIPFDPLTHTTLSLTTLNPRREVFVPEVRVSILGRLGWALRTDLDKRRKKKIENVCITLVDRMTTKKLKLRFLSFIRKEKSWVCQPGIDALTFLVSK